MNNKNAEERPGYVKRFTMTIKTRDGRTIRRANGRPFVIWVKVA